MIPLFTETFEWADVDRFLADPRRPARRVAEVVAGRAAQHGLVQGGRRQAGPHAPAGAGDGAPRADGRRPRAGPARRAAGRPGGNRDRFTQTRGARVRTGGARARCLASERLRLRRAPPAGTPRGPPTACGLYGSASAHSEGEADRAEQAGFSSDRDVQVTVYRPETAGRGEVVRVPVFVHRAVVSDRVASWPRLLLGSDVDASRATARTRGSMSAVAARSRSRAGWMAAECNPDRVSFRWKESLHHALLLFRYDGGDDVARGGVRVFADQIILGEVTFAFTSPPRPRGIPLVPVPTSPVRPQRSSRRTPTRTRPSCSNRVCRSRARH